jgi:hypothetical protein
MSRRDDDVIVLDDAVVRRRIARGELVRMPLDETPVDRAALARLRNEMRERAVRRRERFAERRSR